MNKLIFLFILITILFCHQLLIAQGFTDISIESGVENYSQVPYLMGGGAAFFDYNNDGWEDIYVTGGLKNDRLYENNGDGSFTDISEAVGLSITETNVTAGVCVGDIDNDGNKELFVYSSSALNWAGFNPGYNYLLQLNADGVYEDIAQSAGIIDTMFTMGASFGDFNLDGFLDLIAVNYVDEINNYEEYDSAFYHLCYDNQFYINNGDGTFTESAQALGLANTGCALATAFTDLNFDHNIDIYVANDFGEFILPNYAYLNNYPYAGFTDISASSGLDIGLYGMGIAIGDYDEDLDLDYYVTNLGRNVLLNNNGDMTFDDVTTAADTENTNSGDFFSTSWGCMFMDYDNDSQLDLFVSNGEIPAVDFIETNEIDPNKMFHNNGDGTFTDESVNLGLAQSNVCRGAAYSDFDNDGDLDLYVVSIDVDEDATIHSYLLRNDIENNNNWLKVKLQGINANRDGYGAKVIVHAESRSLLKEIDGGSSHTSHNSSIAHFGLGDIQTIDNVEIIWPGGRQQIINDVATNQLLEVLEDTTKLVNISSVDNIRTTVYPSSLKNNELINIESNSLIKKVELFTVDSKLHSNVLINEPIHKFSIPINSLNDEQTLAKGMYLLKIELETGFFNSKIIIY